MEMDLVQALESGLAISMILCMLYSVVIRVEVRMTTPGCVSILNFYLVSVTDSRPCSIEIGHVPIPILFLRIWRYVLARTYSEAASPSSSLNPAANPPRVEEQCSSWNAQIMVVEWVEVARQRAPGNPLNDAETEWPPEL